LLPHSSLLEGVRVERERLQELRQRADRIIDTSDITVHELKDLLARHYVEPGDERLTISLVTFGYKFGVPYDADLLFDVRFLRNPNFVPELKALTGQTIGPSEWREVTQGDIDTFAELSRDHQWIHVDVERARDESPYGGPIAHGYLVLALTNLFLPQIVEVRGISMGVNYGTDRVRFPAPVPVPSRIRGSAELVDCTEVAGGVQTTMRLTVEVDSDETGAPGEKPACVVDSLSRWLE
jgi:acyl dehydratase